MATQLQLRKGTKIQNDAFTGAEAELTYDSTSKGLRLHDGVKQGGYMVDTVVAWQAPTAENNYTWYRKYSSGWVEQGGVTNYSTGGQTVDLPVIMADTNYSVSVTIFYNSGFSTTGGNTPAHSCTAISTTQIRINQENTSSKKSYWEVKGMCAQ